MLLMREWPKRSAKTGNRTRVRLVQIMIVLSALTTELSQHTYASVYSRILLARSCIRAVFIGYLNPNSVRSLTTFPYYKLANSVLNAFGPHMWHTHDLLIACGALWWSVPISGRQTFEVWSARTLKLGSTHSSIPKSMQYLIVIVAYPNLLIKDVCTLFGWLHTNGMLLSTCIVDN
jgi:hypothetical protein